MDRGIELLLDCLKNEEQYTKLKQLQGFSAAEWEEIYNSAVRSRLSPLLYNTLKTFFDNLPEAESICGKLRLSYYSSAAHNMRLYRQLLDLVTLLNDNQVPIILLKGSHLAEVVYGNIALRHMSDMDLLIKPNDLQKVDRILKSKGYSSLQLLQGNSFEHLAPYSKQGAVPIEIHHQITEPPFSKKFAVEDLWNRARWERINRVEVLTLAPEDLLLHLSAHVSIHHGFSIGLTPYIDIAHTVRYYENALNWEVLWKRSDNWGMRRALYLVLALTDKMVGLPVPGFITDDIAGEPEIKKALSAAEEIIFFQKNGSPQFIARLFGPEPLKVKLQIIRKRLFPAEEFIFIPAVEKNSDPTKIIARRRAKLLRIRGLYERHSKTVWKAIRRDTATVKALKNENRRNDLRRWMGQE